LRTLDESYFSSHPSTCHTGSTSFHTIAIQQPTSNSKSALPEFGFFVTKQSLSTTPGQDDIKEGTAEHRRTAEKTNSSLESADGCGSTWRREGHTQGEGEFSA
jgi:hypothetical protein